MLGAVHALGGIGLVLVVLAGFLIADLLPVGTGIWVTAGLYATVGAYCSLNFWRCREAHCVVTGVGFSVLAVAALAAASGMRTIVFEYQVPILVAVLVAACAFEVGWHRRHGHNAVRLPRSAAR